MDDVLYRRYDCDLLSVAIVIDVNSRFAGHSKSELCKGVLNLGVLRPTEICFRSLYCLVKLFFPFLEVCVYKGPFIEITSLRRQPGDKWQRKGITLNVCSLGVALAWHSSDVYAAVDQYF